MSGSNIISKSKGKPAEDSLFVTPTAVGIADGVGGWIEYGVDSSKFSNELMQNCAREVQQLNLQMEKIDETSSESSSYDLFGADHLETTNRGDIIVSEVDSVSQESSPTKLVKKLDPKTILSKAFKKVKSVGSSTACVWAFDPSTAELDVANLGDSGFLVLRKIKKSLKVVYQSEEQQHWFNAPYQLTRMPRGFAKKHKISGYYSDKPEDAEEYKWKLQRGDIILLATDGLFDNLYTKDIIKTATQFLKKHSRDLKISGCDPESEVSTIVHCLESCDADELARNLTLKAWKKSLSSNYLSPFGRKMNSVLSNNSTRLIPEIDEWRGGKKDDISVVVSFVQ